MPIFEVPLCVRYINLENKAMLEGKGKYVNVDGKGVFLYCNEEETPSMDLIRKIKPKVEKRMIFVSGERYSDALVGAFMQCKGMIIGGSDTYSKATWIDSKVAIIEFPPCFMMHKNEEDIFVCGKLMPCGHGEFGQCVVTTRKYRWDCTFMSYREKVSRNYKKYLKSAKEVVFKKIKYKLIKSSQVFMEFPPIVPAEEN